MNAVSQQGIDGSQMQEKSDVSRWDPYLRPQKVVRKVPTKVNEWSYSSSRSTTRLI